jgi:hypothetical protein
VAFAAALLWCLHPLNTEVVDYVSQRTESMMGLLYLLTLYAASRAMASPTPDPGRSGFWTAVSIASCALGMAAKESMVTAPVVVLLYDAVFGAGSIAGALRARRGLYLGLSAGWIVLGVLMSSGPRAHSVGLASGVTSWTYLLNQAHVIAAYLTLVVWPRALVLDYGPTPPVTLAAVWPQLLAVLILMLAVAVCWRWKRQLAFLGAVAFITLAPTSSVVPIATEVGAERRMYLPLVAIVVLVVVAAVALLRWTSGAVARRYQYAAAAVLILVASGLAIRSARRNAEYHDPVLLWTTVLEHRPHGRAHHNLAVVLRERGDRAGAIDHYTKALTDFPDAHYAVGYELEVDGRHDEAIAHLREYVRLRPLDANARLHRNAPHAGERRARICRARRRDGGPGPTS